MTENLREHLSKIDMNKPRTIAEWTDLFEDLEWRFGDELLLVLDLGSDLCPNKIHLKPKE